MIEVGLPGIALLCAFAVCSSLSGVAVSYAMPWSKEARRCGLSSATGVALGPFLFGFGAIFALGVFRGASHATHLGIAAAFVTLVGVAGLGARALMRARFALERRARVVLSVGEWALVIVLSASVIALVAISVLVPLTQNDALEYALAARELYFTRDLLIYPILNPETNRTGFFGPWTHPPLYVALLYAAEVVQGHAQAPGAMRLIAPWFLLCGAYLAYGIGALVDRTTGLVSAVLFMSPPLLFLGAGSALLDSMPVLGLTLVLAALIGLKTDSLKPAVIIGVLLGVSLWTHSQAVLFLPLIATVVVLQQGARAWRTAVLAVMTILAVAVVVAGWPYVRNVQLFGALVSDNPAVFALPKLHWDDYFSIGRGLGSRMALLQYGVLKGWFAIEAYGFVFWAMTIGVVVFIGSQSFGGIRQIVVDGTRSLARPQEGLWLLIALILCYLAGATLSLALGVDHLVKNERYLLVTLPMVTVVAAYGLVAVINKVSKASWVRSSILTVTAAALSANVVVLIKYSSQKFDINAVPLFAPMEAKLVTVNERNLVAGMDADGDRGLVLTLKPADMYYGHRKMISYLDPRMLPFYLEDDPENAVARLRELGVVTIHIPSYGLPPLYNSQLYRILASPEYTTLNHQNAAGQVYELKPQVLTVEPGVDLSPDRTPWTVESLIVLGGRKMLSRLSSGHHALVGSWLCHGLSHDIFHRHWINVAKVDVTEDGDARSKAAQYRMSVRVAGEGLLRLSVEQFSGLDEIGAGRSLATTPITSFELSENQPSREYQFRFNVNSDARAIAMMVEGTGNACVQLQNLTAEKLVAER